MLRSGYESVFHSAVRNVDSWLELLLVLSLTLGKMINGMFERLKVVEMNMEQIGEVIVVFDFRGGHGMYLCLLRH